MIDSEQGRPNYTLADLEKLFFVRRDLSDLEESEVAALLRKVNAFGLADVRDDSLQLLLCILHDARTVDQDRFLRDVFLPWQGLRRRTQTHFERVGAELARIGEFEPGSVQDAAHVVNMYRNIVADLVDPYLTLVVACFQFIEGTFTTLDDADIGQGERNKHEYLVRRVNDVLPDRPTFLTGYDPRVRNAVSHSGSRGVTYHAGGVVFRSIRRGTPPTVETVRWSHDELYMNTLHLLEGIQSIEVAVEVFGLDCSSAVVGDLGNFFEFLLHAVPPQLRTELRIRHEELCHQIRDADLPEGEKVQALADLLFFNCGLRNMQLTRVKLSMANALVVVEVDGANIDSDDDDQLLGRMAELPRYAILARTVFGTAFNTFVVAEKVDDPPGEQIVVTCTGSDLDDYIEERAGLIDLLNDSSWSLKGSRIEAEVDFEALAAHELTQPSDPLPRKPRPGED